jgi:hypothetical protein
MFFEEVSTWFEKRANAEALYWAGVLIWAGVVFATDSLGVLPQVGSASAWSWIFLGAGLYGTLVNLYSSAMPVSVTTTWDYIWSGFWLVLGLSGFVAVDIFWPVVLTLVGAAFLVKAFRDR